MAADPTRQRFPSVDLLRGLVMMIMALDHMRDFIHVSAMSFPPDDLTKTTTILFFTRWITHFCAPAFAFTAGLGAWLKLERDGNIGKLARFLWTRGLWLVVLEFTVVHLVFFFHLRYDLVFLLVFWSLGMSMIALSALIRLPYRVLFGVSVAMIALHNLTDKVQAATFGPLAGVWQVLHQQSVLVPGPPTTVIVAYPLIPWIGVMSLGFCVGRAYRLPAADRQRLFIRAGIAMVVAFIAIRWLNVYGDFRPWTTQSRPVLTVLSFLKAAKYPPSLDFLLMTLGPALIFLGAVERARPTDRNPLIVFGRTPLFYFVVHLAVIHAIEIGLTAFRYGLSAPFLFLPPPTVGSARDLFPPDFGWSLTTVYLATALVWVVMYPLCLWLSRLKATRKYWWLSYV